MGKRKPVSPALLQERAARYSTRFSWVRAAVWLSMPALWAALLIGGIIHMCSPAPYTATQTQVTLQASR